MQVQPEEITPERVKEIVSLLKNSEENNDLKHELIKGHIKMAFKCAARFSRKYPRFREDIQSEAFLAVVKAVDRIKHIKHEEYTKFIAKYVHSAIATFLNFNTRPLNIPFKRAEEMEETVKSFNEVETLESRKESEEHLTDTFERIIKSAELNTMEHQIILLHLTGHTDSEIAKQFDLSQQRINKIKNNVIGKLRDVYESDSIS